ncbi:hypothetical protein B484DRAFT_403830 [Ochromonadaceae sp. CCMP2298]|nr:hypothetical protein B484DRAFT_403830 [Ochromonadaceae sp. CCMP2298]
MGDVKFDDEEWCCTKIKILYPPSLVALLENGGFDRSGRPDYVPPNSPVWRYIVLMDDGVESVRLQSKKIEQMVEQAVRLIDGTADPTNGTNIFSMRERAPACRVHEAVLSPPVEWMIAALAGATPAPRRSKAAV